MLPKSPLIVQDLNNLHLDIHTIGYPDEGESLLTLLCDGDRVLFSALTDCYEDNHYNHAKILLNRLQVKHVDAFIWTHPDEDHSVGIPNFLDEFDSDHTAKIFLPNTLNKDMGLGEKAKDAFEYVIKYYNSNRKYRVNYVQEHQQEDDEPLLPRSPLSLKIKVMKPQGEINFSYNFILPNDNVVNRLLNFDSDTYFNDLSIVYFITFNNFSFFFCGDLSERNVQFIHPDFYRNSVFIKIPHHGSDNYKNKNKNNIVPIVPMFRSQNVEHAISTTTVFKRQNLPKDEVLKEYCTISDGVYCTSNIHEQSSEPYGCITVKFYANMQEPEVITSGNAYCYHQA